MNILITGCAGFIGSNLSEALINQKYRVVGLDNFDEYYSREIKEDNLKKLKQSKFFKLYECDIRDKTAIEEIFNIEKPDVVIHLAAKAGVRLSVKFPEEYFSVNIDGTKNILEAMKKYDVKKFIFASSSSVYGNLQKVPFNENEEGLIQLSPYAVSKYKGESLIREYSDKYKINSVCLRLFTVYGKRQRPDLAICKFAKSILNNLPITVYGNGQTYRDYTHIEDITDGFISAIHYNKTPFEIINLGSSNPISLSEMIKLLEEICNKKAIIEQLPLPNCDMEKTYADISKASRLLKYSPKVQFKEGLTQFVGFLEQ